MARDTGRANSWMERSWSVNFRTDSSIHHLLMQPVMHVIDFISLADYMPEQIGPARASEMLAFLQVRAE